MRWKRAESKNKEMWEKDAIEARGGRDFLASEEGGKRVGKKFEAMESPSSIFDQPDVLPERMSLPGALVGPEMAGGGVVWQCGNLAIDQLENDVHAYEPGKPDPMMEGHDRDRRLKLRGSLQTVSYSVPRKVQDAVALKTYGRM